MTSGRALMVRLPRGEHGAEVSSPDTSPTNDKSADVAGAMPEGGATDNSPANKWQHPPSFYCPISQQCMHDPVVLSDGHSYERRHIERWLQHHETSPVSGLRLSQSALFPNHALRNAIEEYFQQVFSAHRRAIRKTMDGPLDGQGGASKTSSTSLVRTIDALMECSLLMNADLSTESVLRRIMEEAKTLLCAEVASVFLLDTEKMELFSTVNSTGGELRIPVTVGIAGSVARSGEPLLIHDAYSDSRFDRTVDLKTGFKTRNILCVPLKIKRGGVLGVVQLINKTGAHKPKPEEDSSDEACNDDGACFTADDQHFLTVFASQAATAIVNSGVFELSSPSHDGCPERSWSKNSCGSVAELVKRTLSEKSSGSTRLESIMIRLEEGVPEIAGAESEDGSAAHSSERPACVLDEIAEAESEDESSAAAPSCEKPAACVLDDPAVLDLLERSCAGWQFNAMDLAQLTDNQPLSVLGEHLFDRCGFVEDLGLNPHKVSSFFQELERGYCESNPYHNRAHAASVLHAMYALLQHGGLAEVVAPAFLGKDACDKNSAAPSGDAQLMKMGCLLAAAVHDYEHQGVNNDYLVKTRHERAIRYNDRHVNEHHHVAEAFDLLLQPRHNFLENLSDKDFRRLRGLVIDLVIATDMADNAQFVKSFAALLGEHSGDEAGKAFAPATEREAVLVLQVAMKCADLGHLALEWKTHVTWVRSLEVEFFQQGDMESEAGLPVSFLMDRDRPGASETQVGFYDFVVLPLFRALVRAAPSAGPFLATATDNYCRWKELDEAKAAEKERKEKEKASSLPAEGSASEEKEP